MRRHGGSILLVLLAIRVGSGDAHAQRNPTAAHFDQMAARLGAGGAAGDFQLSRRPTPARVAALWDTLDALVLRELARKPSVSAASARLGKLRGFEPGGPAKGKGIGPAIHGGLIPVPPPTYWLGALDSAGTLAVAAYELGPVVPGRVSAFARVGGRWRRVARFQPSLPVQPFAVRTGPHSFGILTVEAFLGADRMDCIVKTWSLTPAAMRPVYAYPERLVDCEPQATDSTLTLTFDRFPTGLSAPIVGVRLTYARMFRASGGRLAALRDVPVNPWAVVVDDYFRQAPRQPDRALRLLNAPALARALDVIRSAVEDESGSVAEGTGQVILARSATPEKRRYSAVRSRRGPGGAWRITDVAPAKAPHPRS